MEYLYDAQGELITPTLLLQTKSGEIIGAIAHPSEFTYKKNFNSANEISFTVCKATEERLIWDKLIDFKVVYIPEYDEKYEVFVADKDADSITRSITGTHLCESELSQIKVYNMQINTTDDIIRELKPEYGVYNEYDINFPTLLWRSQSINTVAWDSARFNGKYTNYTDAQKKEVLRNGSMVHRLLYDKAPHYIIDDSRVDQTVKQIPWIREFNFSGTDLLSCFNQIGEEFGVMFEYQSIDRSIGIRDLYNTCPSCGFRGDFFEMCPKCGNKNGIHGQYGEETSIFISTENLATEITRDGDEESFRNCFKVSGGDEIVDTALANINPNGSNYMYYFSEETYDDMPVELSNAIKKYNGVYHTELNTKNHSFSSADVNAYNSVVDYINKYGGLGEEDKFSRIQTTITGFNNLTVAFYEAVDLELMVEHGLLPTVAIKHETLSDAMANITNALTNSRHEDFITIAVADPSAAYDSSMNNTVKNIAKLFFNTALYDISVSGSYTKATSKTGNGSWSGAITLETIQPNEDGTRDTVSKNMTLTISGNAEEFIRQKLKTYTRKLELEESMELFSFDLSLAAFKNKLKVYNLTSLNYISDELVACQGFVTEEDVANTTMANGQTLKDKYYSHYSDRIDAVTTEITLRKGQLDSVQNMLTKINDKRQSVRNNLNIRNYLEASGADLYKVFCSYRREDEYKNDSFISDGLNSSEILKKAQELMDRATIELYKAGNNQYYLTASMSNILANINFKPIIHQFKIGNWVHVQSGEKVYRLRLISYELNGDDASSMTVEFSTASKTAYGYSDIEDILSSASSMSSSYNALLQQSNEQGKVTKVVDGWVKSGFEATTKIVNSADNQDVVYDKTGILLRKFDPVSEVYDECQSKFISNGLYITDDGWKSIRGALGKFHYTSPDGESKTAYGVLADTIVGRQILSEHMYVGDADGNITLSKDGLDIKGSNGEIVNHIGSDGNFDLANGRFFYNYSTNILNLNNVRLDWNTTTNVDDKTLQSFFDDSEKVKTDLGATIINDKYVFAPKIVGGEISIVGNNGVQASISSGGVLSANGANITGAINASSGTIGSGNSKWNIGSSSIYNGTNSLTSTTVGTYVGTDGFRNYSSSSSHTTITGGKITTNNIDASGGTIGGWKITSTDVYNDNSSQCAGIGKVGTSFAFWAGSSYADRNSAPFRVGHNGTLYASNATISGTITAGAGSTIGGWSIGADRLTGGSVGLAKDGHLWGTNWDISSSGVATFNDVRIAGGNAAAGQPTFYINSSNGTIVTNGVTATGGSIGGWVINEHNIWNNNGGTSCGIGQYGHAYAFWAGTDSPGNSGNAPFRVGHGGDLHSTSGDIGGWTITGSELKNSSGSFYLSPGSGMKFETTVNGQKYYIRFARYAETGYRHPSVSGLNVDWGGLSFSMHTNSYIYLPYAAPQNTNSVVSKHGSGCKINMEQLAYWLSLVV